MKWFSMLEHDHKPVSLVGLLLLVAGTLIFLVAIWMIGSAFARPETELTVGHAVNQAVFAQSVR